ncbi:DUF2938 domain-containing protein [Sphingobacterium sp. BIGb0165]|uniref:DUF2938 domain-containing protein n=1 Tax=Sphingobacterium sp. BIGb0165 TaxID=2940615 RepID=UPI00216934BC|nr:DUF2938 domain-containing protein [Sphingobacterium sp. BIGb0165]MCS4226946.1 hypothetical protein [Sphingobacterium sp. BIGb0165]
MNTFFELIIFSIIIGIGATLIMDIYALFLRYIFNIFSLDMGIVGRWIGHFKHGVFVHQNIIQAEKIKGERIIGWVAHYLIGISFAFLLLLICGVKWAYNPTFLPALAIGILTTIAPWFMMQPAFGFGIAASKTPNPLVARLKSLQAHTVYGIGLYLTALFLSIIVS